jgi:co-chaperonin GroES (HSP10)
MTSTKTNTEVPIEAPAVSWVPLGHRVLLKRERIGIPGSRNGGFADAVREPLVRATVVSIGYDECPATHHLQEGDTVLIGAYAGQEVQENGQVFVIVDADKIVARKNQPFTLG